MSMLSQVRSNNERAMSITGWDSGRNLNDPNDLKEISEEDSFADDIESVKGDIERSDGSGVEVAKNIETDKQEETKEIK